MRRAQIVALLFGLPGCTLIGETGGWVCESDDECPALYRCQPGEASTVRICEAAPRPLAAQEPAAGPVQPGPDAGAGGPGRADAGTGPRFKADVQPLLDVHCGGCHGSVPVGNTVRLTAADSHASLVGADSVCAPGTKSVTAGDLQASMLWRKLGGSLMICGQQMPPAGSLKSTQPAAFAVIEAWIRQGAKND